MIKNVLTLATGIFLGGLVLHSTVNGDLEHKTKSIGASVCGFVDDTYIRTDLPSLPDDVTRPLAECRLYNF